MLCHQTFADLSAFAGSSGLCWVIRPLLGKLLLITHIKTNFSMLLLLLRPQVTFASCDEEEYVYKIIEPLLD